MEQARLERFERVVSQLINLDRNYLTGLEEIFHENPELLSLGWLRASDTIDKNEICECLRSILSEVGLTYENFIRLILPGAVPPVPVWKFLWDYICDSSVRTTLERQFWGECRNGVLARIRNSLVNEIRDKLAKGTLNETPEHRKDRLHVLLSAYLYEYAGCYMLYAFIKRYEASISGKLKSLVPLLELSLNGGGILYVASKMYWTVLEGIEMTQEEIQMRHDDPSLRWVVLEIKLPVWREADYPKKVVDIESKKPDNTQVNVIRDSVYVPESVWRYPEKLTAEDIFRERNAELRRIMLNAMGNEKFLKQAGAVVIDRQDNLTLYRVEIPLSLGRRPLHMIQCVCPSTGGEYLLHVPPGITDAREAVAWTFGETKDAYKPEIET